jgi:transposase
MLKDTYDIEPTEVDQLVFAKLVPPTHDLRRVTQVIDFERCREHVKDCYSPAMGRTAEDPVRLIKLAFLPCHDRLSDREVIAAAQVNVAFRFFLDLSLESPLPVPRLLSQCRPRLGEQRHQALFDEVVAQARAHGLVHDRLRLKDATHLVANIAVPTTLQWVAQSRQRLLDSARPSGPQRVAEEEAEAARLREVTADLNDLGRLAARVAHLRAIVAWADAVQQGLGPLPALPDPVRTRFEAALALAHRGLADRDDPDRGDQLRRVVAPDARRGKHGPYVDGDLLEVSEDADSELLTARNVLPGNGDEARDALSLLAAETPAQGNAMQALSMDGIGWQGEVLHALSEPQAGGVAVYVPPPPVVEGPGFGPDQCTLDATGAVVTCPGGQQTRSKARTPHRTGWQFTFARRGCAGCALRTRCMATLPARPGRRVVKHEYQADYDAVWARAQTARYAEVRRQHPRLERKLADLVRYHGGRRCRYRGRWRVKVQYLLVGMVVNLKRIVKLWCPRGEPLAPQAA